VRTANPTQFILITLKYIKLQIYLLLYRYENCYSAVREEHNLGMFEEKVLKDIACTCERGTNGEIEKIK
jgi:hypothetical protein